MKKIPIRVGLAVGLLLLGTALFQNCSKFAPSSGLMQSQLSSEYDQALYQSSLTQLSIMESLKMSFSAGTESLMGLDLNSCVARFNEERNPQFSLSPRTSTIGPVFSNGGDSGFGNVLRFDIAQKNNLESATTGNFFGDQFTIMAVLQNPLRGNLITIGAADYATDSFGLKVEGTLLQAFRSTSTSNHAYMDTDIVKYNKPFVVGVSFQTRSSSVILVINGVRLGINSTVVGAPGSAPYILRQVILGDAVNGANLNLQEVRIFNEALSVYEMNVLSKHLADRWGIKNVSFDPSTRISDGLPPEQISPKWLAARDVIQRRCTGCHTGFHATWQSYGEHDFVRLGLLVKGSAADSYIWQILKRNGGNMPLEDDLTDGEYQIIQDWVSESPR